MGIAHEYRRGLLRASSLVAGLACASVAAPQQAETPQASFRAMTHINTVTVTATGADGLPAGDLVAEDFELWLDGQEQDISFVLAPADVPLEIAILIDTSESIRRNVPDLKADMRVLLESLDDRDCVLMLPFGEEVGPGSWNVDAESFVDDLQFRGNTRLNDALIEALRLISPGTEEAIDPGPTRADGCGSAEGVQGRRRRAAVLITDGRDRGSYATAGEVLLRAWSARIPFIVLGVGEAAADPRTADPGRGGAAERFVAQLDALVRTAGGRFIRAAGREQRERIFEDALDTLRSTYVVASVLPEAPTNVVPEWHTIEVRTRRPDVTVMAPEGVFLSAARRADAAARSFEAYRALDEGSAPVALDILARAVEDDPEFWQPHFLRAIAGIEARRFDEAVASARSAVYLRPLSPDAHALLADALLQQGSPESAARSAVAASHLGLDISGAAAVLEDIHGVRLDLDAQARLPRVWIIADEHTDLPLQQQAARIARLLTFQLAAEPGIVVVPRPLSVEGTYGIEVRLTALDEGALTISSVTDPEGKLRLAGYTATFRLSAPESDSLIGPIPPDVPGPLTIAFTEIWQRRNTPR